MSQTTGAISGAVATVFIWDANLGTPAYVNISGASQSIDAVTATVTSGEAYTFTGAHAIITIGKQEPVEVTVNILYTEISTEPFLIVRKMFEEGDATQIKWLPAGSATGADQYETKTVGYITSMDYPPVDASSAGPVMVSFTLRAPGITYTAFS
jgi:hypothetical protein